MYKATADVAAARAMFDHYSEVPESGAHPFASWIPIILEKKQPRRFLVQSHTELKGQCSAFAESCHCRWLSVQCAVNTVTRFRWHG